MFHYRDAPFPAEVGALQQDFLLEIVGKSVLGHGPIAHRAGAANRPSGSHQVATRLSPTFDRKQPRGGDKKFSRRLIARMTCGFRGRRTSKVTNCDLEDRKRK